MRLLKLAYHDIFQNSKSKTPSGGLKNFDGMLCVQDVSMPDLYLGINGDYFADCQITFLDPMTGLPSPSEYGRLMPKDTLLISRIYAVFNEKEVLKDFDVYPCKYKDGVYEVSDSHYLALVFKESRNDFFVKVPFNKYIQEIRFSKLRQEKKEGAGYVADFMGLMKKHKINFIELDTL